MFLFFVFAAFGLGSLGHALALHALELLSQASLLDLALLLFLGVFEVPLVAELHQVSRVGDGPLEPAEGALDGLAVTDVDLDVDIEGGRRACRAGVCVVCVCESERDER